MSKTKREKRLIGVNSKSKAKKTSSIQVIIGALLLGSLVSCSTLSNHSKSTKESLKSICLSGEGRGRIKIKRNRYLFNFESALQSSSLKSGKWSLGLHVPILGEEVIHFIWEDGKSRASGPFYRRLKASFEAGSVKLEQLESFLKEWASFVMRLALRKEFLGEGLETSRKDGAFLLSKALGDTQGQVVWKYSNMHKFYKRLNLALYEKNNSSADIEVDLFYSSCADVAN